VVSRDPSPEAPTARARRLAIRTRRLVDGLLAGQYHSVFKGSGVEFAEVREYVPGDDVRTIDWNVTARLGTPFVKRHVEERELTVVLLIDTSASCRFGSRSRLKAAVAAELAALLAASAVRNNDRVGLILFSDRVERFEPPSRDRHAVLRILSDLLEAVPGGQRTDLAPALERLETVVRRRAVAFLLSDFQAPDYGGPLRRAHRRHEVVPVCITDRRERELPEVGLLALRDLETGREVLIDTASARVRAEHAARFERAQASRRRLFATLGIDAIEVDTAEDPVRPLLRFFRRRRARLGAGR
jgi:uncharacterized protein (DUF58 family)